MMALVLLLVVVHMPALRALVCTAVAQADSVAEARLEVTQVLPWELFLQQRAEDFLLVALEDLVGLWSMCVCV